MSSKGMLITVLTTMAIIITNPIQINKTSNKNLLNTLMTLQSNLKSSKTVNLSQLFTSQELSQ
jgi:autonomous glycyl radical cofactor GrcA